jgi:hypothetical protein
MAPMDPPTRPTARHPGAASAAPAAQVDPPYTPPPTLPPAPSSLNPPTCRNVQVCEPAWPSYTAYRIEFAWGVRHLARAPGTAVRPASVERVRPPTRSSRWSRLELGPGDASGLWRLAALPACGGAAGARRWLGGVPCHAQHSVGEGVACGADGAGWSWRGLRGGGWGRWGWGRGMPVHQGPPHGCCGGTRSCTDGLQRRSEDCSGPPLQLEGSPEFSSAFHLSSCIPPPILGRERTRSFPFTLGASTPVTTPRALALAGPLAGPAPAR